MVNPSDLIKKLKDRLLAILLPGNESGQVVLSPNYPTYIHQLISTYEPTRSLRSQDKHLLIKPCIGWNTRAEQ